MRCSFVLVWACLVFVTGLGGGLRGETTGLYTPLGATTLADQGFGYIVNPPFGARSTVTGSAGGTVLDTVAAITESAGFFTHNPFDGSAIHPASPVLDRAAGFDLRFELALGAESHASQNRAGFSVIAISSDGKGVEIAFWTNEIWAYDDDRDGAANLFKHAEGVAQSPTAMASARRYDLVLLADRYVLSIDGVAALSGRVRDYGHFVGPTFPIVGELDPYEVPNLIFLGDDTSSAASRSALGAVSATVLPAGGVIEVDSVLSPGHFSLAWDSLPGVRYAVHTSGTLSQWGTAGQVLATDVRASFSAPLGDASRTFYRIEREGIPE